MIERRAITRTAISKSALLFFNGQRGVSTCLVRNITNAGAGIQLRDLKIFPLNFDVSFDNFRTVRKCRVA